MRGSGSHCTGREKMDGRMVLVDEAEDAEELSSVNAEGEGGMLSK